MNYDKLFSNSIADVYRFRGSKGVFEGVISKPQQGKVVFILSTLYGCPVQCPICDAGDNYRGVLSVRELLEQFECLFLLISDINRYNKVKIQFSRMGEPAFNRNVIDAASILLERYRHIQPIISISSVVPAHCARFFAELGNLLDKHGRNSIFQIQFSIHSTDYIQRDEMIPIQKVPFGEMGYMGSVYSSFMGRKTTLNFALHNNTLIDANVLIQSFPTDYFIIKLTPVNPTDNATLNNISTCSSLSEWEQLLFHADNLRNAGYEVIESIGDFRENQVFSNCGQYVKKNCEK